MKETKDYIYKVSQQERTRKGDKLISCTYVFEMGNIFEVNK